MLFQRLLYERFLWMKVIFCGAVLMKGLVLIKDNKVVQKFISNDSDTTSLSNNRVSFIYGDHNKNIWVGTKSGLNLFNPLKNNFKRFASGNGLNPETIMSIQEDKPW